MVTVSVKDKSYEVEEGMPARELLEKAGYPADRGYSLITEDGRIIHPDEPLHLKGDEKLDIMPPAGKGKGGIMFL